MAKLELRFPDGLKETHELLPSRSLVIGSDPSADVRIFRDGIQPKHAVIRWADRRYHLEVSPQVRNVFVGVNPVTQLRLKPDAEFSIGDIECRLKYSPEELGAVSTSADDPYSTTVNRSQHPPLYQSQSFLGIVTGLVVLAILSVGLFFLIRSKLADDEYAAAKKDMTDGLYAKGVAGFDEFLKSYSSDSRAPEAAYLRAKARVLQYSEGSAISWPNAFTAAQRFVAEASTLPEFKKHPTEISNLFLKISSGLAQQSRDRADAKLLDQSRELVALTQKTFPSLTRKKEYSQVEAMQQQAEQSVERGSFIDELLKRMDQSLGKDSPREVYRAFAELNHRYPDKIYDKRIRERLSKATDKEKGQVRFTAATPVSAPQAVSSLPSWTRYARSVDLKEGSDIALPVNVADVLYAIDSGNGTVKWRRPVGYPVAFRPTRINGDSAQALAYRPDDNELTMIDLVSGKEVSRLPLGTVRPRSATEITVAPDRVFVVAVEDEKGQGQIVSVKTSGTQLLAEGIYHFPQPILTPPAFDNERNTLLVVAEEGSMFVVNQETHEVESMITLAHEAGAIKHRPVMTGRFILFDQRKGIDSSLLRCFVVSSKDGSVREAAQAPLKGHCSESPTIKGGRLFLATDQGEYSVFEFGAETDVNPLTKALTYTNLDAAKGVPAFIRAVDETDIWIFSASAAHFFVNVPRKQMELVSSHPLPGPASRESIVLNAQPWAITADRDRGGVSALRIDPANLSASLVTTLGVLPRGAGAVNTEGSPKFMAAHTSDRQILTDADLDKDTVAGTIHSGPIMVTGPQPAPAIVDSWQNGLVQVLDGVLQYAPPTSSESEGLRNVNVTGRVNGLPAKCGDGLLVPSEAGYVYWINPESGQELADPFAGPFENGQPFPLHAVVAVDASDPSRGAVAAGGKTLFRLELSDGDSKAWKQSAKTDLPDDGNIRQLVAAGDVIWVIREHSVTAVKPHDLSVMGSSSVSPSSLPAIGHDGKLLLCTNNGELMAVGLEVDAKVSIHWQKSLPALPVDRPVVSNDRAWILLSNGSLSSFHVTDGNEGNALSYKRWMSRGPWLVGSSFVGIAADGSVLRLPQP
ncbi:FHA domain-containing protein [bacterium]|nr:FHA domain-containing protein [bacterium]